MNDRYQKQIQQLFSEEVQVCMTSMYLKQNHGLVNY